MERVDPPKIPDTIQPYYSLDEVETILKSIGRQTAHNLRDSAMILALYDSGVRATELCGMRTEDLDRRDRTILVTGKDGKQDSRLRGDVIVRRRAGTDEGLELVETGESRTPPQTRPHRTTGFGPVEG